ncbi:MFS transporter [Acetobacter sp. AN02]|uniref:MFS transporter n=1 Tax=Acetobacter sp. AN02 TaxID=2894186 RepID=UPI0024345DC0|nr:MFS transporter [Acetobacter sp. AN02]MDG6094886.1 MFS transporter [Acetobacter sp. AN02]
MTQSDFRLSPAMTGVFAAACGLAVANIYYAQALIGPITRELAVSPALAGSIVMFNQIGYGAGLFFIVPLSDRSENRRLILMTFAGLVAALVGAALSRSGGLFMACSVAVGLCSVGCQILLPLATRFVTPAERGRVIGNIMGGLLTGIMLSRPLANAVAAVFGWRAMFWISAVMMALTGAVLWRVLPRYTPEHRMSYGALLRSIGHLVAEYAPLRQRILCQGLLFAVFNMFWTSVPLMLHARFGLGQAGIAAFALAGAGGALAAPVAGRLADAGYTRAATWGAIGVIGCASLLSGPAVSGDWLIGLAVLALFLDAGVQTNQIVSQRVVYGLHEGSRGRLNAAYMTAIFLFGAAGSGIGAALYSRWDWWGFAVVAVLLCVVNAAIYALFLLRRRGTGVV